MAAQTLYLRSTASAVVSSAAHMQQLSTTQGSAGTSSNTSIKNARNTGTWQFIPATTSNTTAYTAASTPNSQGWIFDSQGTGTYAAGSWTLQIATSNSSGTGSANVKASLWVVTASTTAVTSFTLLGEAVASSSFTNTATETNRTITFSSIPEITLASGKYLYVEVYYNVTSAGTGASATENIYLDSNTTTVSKLTTTSFSSTSSPTPVQVSSSVTASAFSGTSVSVSLSLPSTPTVGNVMVACVGINNGVSSWSPPTGWTLDTSSETLGYNDNAAWFWRVVQSGDGTSYSFTANLPSSASGTIGGFMEEWSGIDTTTPMAGGNATSVTALGWNSGVAITSGRNGSIGLCAAVNERNTAFNGTSDVTDGNYSNANAWCFAAIHASATTSNSGTWTPEVYQDASASVTLSEVFLQPPSGTVHNQSLTATLTESGSPTKRASLIRAASIAISGARALAVTMARSATLAPLGVRVLATTKNLAATIAFVGAKTATTTKNLAAALTPTSTITKAATLVRSAGLVASGAIKKTVALSRAALLVPLGARTISVGKKLSASIVFAGSAVASRATIINLAATLALQGAAQKTIGKLEAASLSPSAPSPLKSIGKSLLSAISSSAVALKTPSLQASASLAPGGTLRKTVNLIRLAALVLVGNAQATLIHGGQTFNVALTATLSALGSASKTIGLTRVASISPASTLRKAIDFIRSAILKPIASIFVPRPKTLFSVSLATSRSIESDLSAIRSFQSSLATSRSIDIGLAANRAIQESLMANRTLSFSSAIESE